MLLGEQVQRDRERAGWSQDEFAKRLNSSQAVPRDPHTKVTKKAYRSWVAKLESGVLQRDLRLEVREWLATTLGSDLSIYRILPFRAHVHKQDSDLQREQTDFLKKALAKFEPRSQIRIDSPATGPLSNQFPHLLFLILGIITKHDSELIIYSNEYSSENKTYDGSPTLQCAMLLYVLVGLIENQFGKNASTDVAKIFVNLDWENDIETATRDIFESIRRGKRDEVVILSDPTISWLKNHLVVHIIKDSPRAADRYNPLTLILAESLTNRAAYAIDGERHLAWELENVRAVTKTFDDRRVLFESFDPDIELIVRQANLYGIKLVYQPSLTK